MPISKIHRDGDKFSSWWIFYYIVTEINFHHDKKNDHPPTLFTRPRYQSHDNRVSANLYPGMAIIVPRSCFYSNFPANGKLALHISNRSHKKRLFKYIYPKKIIIHKHSIFLQLFKNISKRFSYSNFCVSLHGDLFIDLVFNAL